MRTSALLLAAGSAALTAAHGIVNSLNIDGADFSGYLPYNDPYSTPVPERIVWAFPTAGNGPVENVATSDITCNKAATAAALSAPAAAGSKVTFFWTTWPESHKGPVMTYLANCGGDCSTVDATTLSYFKIDEAGLNADGSWASDDLIANNNSWTVTIPSDIAAGSYLLRHELLALHSAGTSGGAQFYPMCANLEITGSGTAKPEGVKFPGAYSATDPGILVNIYGTLTSYTIPGPAVYGSSGSGSGSSPVTTTVTSAPVVEATSAVETSTPVETIAPVETVTPVETTPAVETTPVVETSAPVETIAPIETVSPVETTPVSTPAPVPTTLVTRTRSSTSTAAAPATTSAAGSTGGCSATSEAYNKCMDSANECIRGAQPKNGGPVDFSGCEALRAGCKMC